jgi:predicted helicase
MTLNLDDIKDGNHFEDLVVSYFEDLKNEGTHNIIDIKVKPSGLGNDGGRDVLVDFQITDNITTFNRRWIIQCKFHNSSISTNKIADVNIPTLIHSYKATGYLLICKKNPTSKLTDMFERLSDKCRMDYQYYVWSGEQFKRLILAKSTPKILEQYFPIYYKYCKKMENNTI